MTSPQTPWNSGGYPQYPQSGTPSGAFPQQQYPQGGYAQYPRSNPFAAPPVPGHDLGEFRRPATVEVAFWISVVVPLLATVLSVVSYLLLQGWMNDSLSGMGDNEYTAEITSVANGFLLFFFIFFTIIYLILTALWILFGFKMRAGRNWARITLTVLASMWLLSSLVSLVQGGTMLTGSTVEEMEMPGSFLALTYTQGGLGVVGMALFITLVFLKPSNWYFQAANRR
ncbi:hypothetical protein GCM10011581_32840 [Saccharopolyspora subtropica]|uniref:Uncharacterized protein n=1 Tax=Saccharopolyspora thermophila TaxID=89367 RepID=A0A917JZP5_9PSEU|nr:hypothetical protein [Saccharopolyspora subtropica]GGI93168.1 hypothetical protein GCM10011581_32840 [Saccharopolyspora subtropica]